MVVSVLQSLCGVVTYKMHWHNALQVCTMSWCIVHSFKEGVGKEMDWLYRSSKNATPQKCIGTWKAAWRIDPVKTHLTLTPTLWLWQTGPQTLTLFVKDSGGRYNRSVADSMSSYRKRPCPSPGPPRIAPHFIHAQGSGGHMTPKAKQPPLTP